MDQLLNFNVPVDVGLLERIVEVMYKGQPEEKKMASSVLTDFKENPQAWTRVDVILDQAQSQHTKFYALSILEDLIKYRWKILPQEQQVAIRGVVVHLILKLAADEMSMKANRLALGKLNQVLVQILKHEWPHRWESFIPDLIANSRTSESLCENNMHILQLLSEEIFDFSHGEMTKAKTRSLKTTLNKEFSMIFNLCSFVLDNLESERLLIVTLHTLHRYLCWIPLGFIFETKLLNGLLYKFLPIPSTRNDTMRCLIEVASLTTDPAAGGVQESHFVDIFQHFMKQLVQIIPPKTDIPNACENGTSEDEDFVHSLALFLTTLFKNHLDAIEKSDTTGQVLQAHYYLANITMVDSPEIFKICLEYWQALAHDLYHQAPSGPLVLHSAMQSSTGSSSDRRAHYAPVLSRVRIALISNMAKPEEVIIVEDENGEIVKERTTDTASIALYNTMRETLVYLTHLDAEDTRTIMLEKMSKQCKGGFAWRELNTLCWAIGSIAGSMSENAEKRFLVVAIRDLLQLCEVSRGKDNKAVIASNIMYIVGSYPRFLKAHWQFLRTVIMKLFEFMHETFPGVQDMACDTFIKIAKDCRKQFVKPRPPQGMFVETALQLLPGIIADLSHQQIPTFYEAIGYMIRAHPDENTRQALLNALMALPNQTWARTMAAAAQNFECLKQPDTARGLANILRTNVSVAKTLGNSYISQLSRIFLDMLNVYKAYSEVISTTVGSMGPMATQTAAIRAMRSVKKETLLLVEMFVEKSTERELISKNFMPPLLEGVLSDYKSSIPAARDPEVLSLLASIISRLRDMMTSYVPPILEAVLSCTLEMITQNFADYPTHRIHFFGLLRAINSHCFKAFFMIPAKMFKLIIDSVDWAFKHTMQKVAQTGLEILLELLRNISRSNVANAFYAEYFVPLMQDILYVLTDRLHKAGFTMHATILFEMCRTVESGMVGVPLWGNQQVEAGMTNQRFIREHIFKLLASNFPNVTKTQLQHFVTTLFDASLDLPTFKSHVRDFLVELKEFNKEEDLQLLYLEEQQLAEQQRKAAEEAHKRSVPGLYHAPSTAETAGGEGSSMMD
mmetsp:Transcript_49557/g.124609  ORF Transcript_49557/g.124609 Transcript_49557/m.124609 type:complete len:1073 (-) Transcript_49557:41-3259(-)|eukprot:CAMPEP_0177647952 /NCGR_PEP_ID=MMETSP0447-20121125/10570_1 /TAXON_ID=0 /ORGANISM="Stygamoeba regulata, Strain BSH-02190019" /LENGTH=1072 /DNA_ID=CAMNT_0019150563 /DNA_START=243 /DNA_END=3461 /DNA_ORIENTATION=+